MSEFKQIQTLANTMATEDESQSKKTRRLKFEAGVSELLDKAGLELKDARYNGSFNGYAELTIAVRGVDANAKSKDAVEKVEKEDLPF